MYARPRRGSAHVARLPLAAVVLLFAASSFSSSLPEFRDGEEGADGEEEAGVARFAAHAIPVVALLASGLLLASNRDGLYFYPAVPLAFVCTALYAVYAASAASTGASSATESPSA